MNHPRPASYWEQAFHPARAFWLARGLYLLLALDALLLMLQHAGRYGAGGFNVAHFAWLERVFPRLSPAPYLALLTAAALLALCGSVRSLSRPAQGALLVSYTLAWALSQHDSYQHHYLLSWLLAWLLLLPRPSLRDCVAPDASISGPGLALTSVTCAIVYAFTAVSKSSSAWQSGAVLRQLARTPGPFSLLATLDEALGGVGQVFRLAAGGVLCLQLVIAAAYLVAPARDGWERAGDLPLRARAARIMCGVGWLGAFSFHLLTELQTSFSIGWFSYYMLWISAVMFAPSAWLARVSAEVAHSAQLPSLPDGRATCLVLLGAAAVMVTYLALTADLPGVSFAVVGVGLAYLSMASWQLREGRTSTASGLASSLILSLGVTLTCLTLGHVRFDYYRRLAGEMRRMGQLPSALEFYRKAERYAPGGQSRAGVIRAIERELSEQRRERHGQL